ncbi:uncharacterized protein LOC129456301 [Periophthalmus magnuspinnatus]|uniref:uncharacterized protein LOC129456301 n=1 Tax=Periophthalmus magnuspinnatus TaxID=409849 RepID=UPI0024367A6A|nr:uncharacterized protein LOC129456301 [Periophthalmus magnuspinnatus]
MSGLMIALLIFFGLACSERLVVFGSVVDVRVELGEDIVMHCDCTTASGVLVVWYRNCSHAHQPTLVLKLRTKYLHHLRNDPVSWMTPLPRFRFVKNDSSNSYDLSISNVTESDVGLYYCGTETPSLEEDGASYLQKTYKYEYGNTSTQLTLKSSGVSECSKPEWWSTLVLTVTVILFSNLCFIVLYHLCHRKHDDRFHTTAHQDQDPYLTIVEFGAKERKNQ